MYLQIIIAGIYNGYKHYFTWFKKLFRFIILLGAVAYSKLSASLVYIKNCNQDYSMRLGLKKGKKKLIYLSLCEFRCTICMHAGTHRSQKASDLLALELQYL